MITRKVLTPIIFNAALLFGVTFLIVGCNSGSSSGTGGSGSSVVSVDEPTLSWFWAGGSNIANVTDNINFPSARRSALTWQAQDGSLYVFGGINDSVANPVMYNDLWHLPVSQPENFWEYLGADASGGGSDFGNNLSIYTGENAYPGSRSSAVSWVDKNDRIWTFGGHGYTGTTAVGMDSDMWYYNTSASSSKAIKVSGTTGWVYFPQGTTSTSFNAPGVYGSIGQAGNPGAREAAVSWVDANGDFWMFGGYGYDSTGTEGFLNDVWKFHPDVDAGTGTWIWVAGSNLANSEGSYSGTEYPSGRSSGYPFVVGGNTIYMYGGANNDGNLGDLWKLNYSLTVESTESPVVSWTCMGCTSENVSESPSYGTRGMYNPSNTPGARSSGTSWVDAKGNLWLFGGANGSNDTTRLNDVWKFNFSKNSWVWVGGSSSANLSGNYPAQPGDQGLQYYPGSRSNTMSFSYQGVPYLFGGYGYDSAGTLGELNDFWAFTQVEILDFVSGGVVTMTNADVAAIRKR